MAKKIFKHKYGLLKIDQDLLEQIGYTNQIPDYLTKYQKPSFIRYKLRYSLPKFKKYLKYLQEAVNNDDVYYIVPTRSNKYMALYLRRDLGLETLKKVVPNYDSTFLSMTDTHYIYKLASTPKETASCNTMTKDVQ